MKSILFASALIVTVVSISLVDLSRAHADAWDDALKPIGLTKSDLRIDRLDRAQFGGDFRAIPYFEPLHGDPLRIPFYVRTYREMVLKPKVKPSELLVGALAKIGLGIRRDLGRDPLAAEEKRAKEPSSLANAIARLHRTTGKPLQASARRELERRIKTLPEALRPIAAFMIEAIASAHDWRAKALEPVRDRKALAAAFVERMKAPEMDGEDTSGASPLLRRLDAEVDLAYLMTGGIDLTLAAERAAERLREQSEALNSPFTFDWDTPIGRVALRGPGNDSYSADRAYLLIIDVAGDDTYFAGGASHSIEKPIGVLIDVTGNDRYLAETALEATSVAKSRNRRSNKIAPAFGAGVLGYGITLDLAGDDRYSSFRQTQGRGDFGVGVLWDAAGDDHFDCYTQCQGSGEFGAGLLIDGAGADERKTFQQAQGFGGIRGAGLLVDSGEGSDLYLANIDQLDFPSLIDKAQNTSFAQGAALGLRADVIDGHSYSGGFGALVDGGGDNRFQAGFFAQGVAYWYGVGLLSTGSGHDHYEAKKYAQAAATHFGVGILHDGGGNDSYKVEQELGIGHGHDFGVAALIEEAGDDTYDAPNLSLGCASANGIGIFWDRGGRDRYSSSQPLTMGCASFRSDPPTIRLRAPTVGVFLDQGGEANSIATPAAAGPAKANDRREAAWRSEGDGHDRAKPKLLGTGLVTASPGDPDPLR